MNNQEVRPLPPLNCNYNPPAPWVCMTHEEHDCVGRVVGAIGAYPVCENGAEAELAARRADEARIAKLTGTPEWRRAMRKEADVERWIEARF